MKTCKSKLNGVAWALGAMLLASTLTTMNAMDRKEMSGALQKWLGEQPGGVAAAYVDASGVVFANAGKFSADDARPVNEDTEFEIGSVTKVFTALLLEDGVRAGKMKLEDKVGAPFPASEVTYAQLATHTSGLPRLPRDFAPADAANPYAEMNLAALVKSFENEAPKAKATSGSNYSNFGFAVLGQAVAATWGQPYEVALKERVLRPPGLKDTATSWRDVPAERMAPGHDEQGVAAHWDSNAYAPAGALVSTTRELARFLQACLGFVETPLAGVLAETMRPRVPADATSGRRVGLAWMIEKDGVVWHNGGTGGFRSVVILDPAKRIGVVVLTNHTRGVEALGKVLLEGKEAGAAGFGDPALHKTVAPAAEALLGYLGNYPLAPSFVMAVTAEGETLFMQATGQPRLTLKKESEDRFAVVGVEAAVSFERGADGKVTALVLHQGGRDQRAPRLAAGEKPAAPKEIALTAEELEPYVGRYQLGPAMFTVKREDARLLVQLTGQPFFQVFASAKDEFFYKVVNAQLSFVRAAEGKVVALVLHQNGKNSRAEKVKE